MRCIGALRKLSFKPLLVNRRFFKISFLVLLLCSSPFFTLGATEMNKKKRKPIHTADANLMRSSVDSLCNDSVYRTWNNTKELTRAGNYVFRALSEFSNRTEKQNFNDKKNTYFNVISSFGPEDAPRLIIGAHYDVCGQQQGADDNASGVSSLIELARLLNLNQTELSYRIDLVAYTLEEPPFFRDFMMGSAVHARSLKKDSVDVIGMISLEMIGFYSEEKGSQGYPAEIMKLIYPGKANYISLVSKFGGGDFLRKVRRGMKAQKTVNVRSVTAPVSLPGIDFSDHFNYWNQGYSALMITDTSFYRNANYHMPSDLPSTLNYEKMAAVTDGVFQLILNFNT